VFSPDAREPDTFGLIEMTSKDGRAFCANAAATKIVVPHNNIAVNCRIVILSDCLRNQSLRPSRCAISAHHLFPYYVWENSKVHFSRVDPDGAAAAKARLLPQLQ
jgi:hypothetical protein